MRPLLLVAFLAVSPAAWGRAQFYLTGLVIDRSSGEPLGGVNIRILGSSNGTISNPEGKYTVRLERGGHSIGFSYLGYQPDTVRLGIVSDTVVDISLKPSPIQIPEILVLAEDPAVEIIRKAIANKRTWMDRLKSYTFEAFTRQVLRRDTAIASITEAYTSGFYRAGDTLREIVRQRRQTQNIPVGENFAAVRRIVNFNEDKVTLFTLRVGSNAAAYTFVGPTAPNALECYDYRLLRTSRVNGVNLYTIRMTPRTRLKPLFDGVIIIADGTFAVMGVDVKPNELFAIPLVKNIDLEYRQQFALYDSLFWMPTDIRIRGGFNVSIIGFSLPRIGIDLLSAIYSYGLNAAIPESVFQKPHITIDSSASAYDTSFWRATEVVPLTREEQGAYATLDSAQTLEKQFRPKGPLATLGSEGAGKLLDYLDLRFNRVEGLYLGADIGVDRLSSLLSGTLAAGYGFSDKRFSYRLAAAIYSSEKRRMGLGAEWHSKLDHVPDGGFYGPPAISLMALLDKHDYRDYFTSQGWRAFITAAPSRTIGIEAGFTSEQDYSMGVQTDFSLLSRNKIFRPNPEIWEGAMRSISFNVRLGPEAGPLDFVSRNALEVAAELSSPKIAGSEFDYTRWSALLIYNLPTFARDLIFPPLLRIRLSGGAGFGALPPQRMFALESRSGGYAPFGVLRGSEIREFGGDRFLMMNLEHNFRNIPLLALDVPALDRSGVELILEGSVAQSWNHSTSTSGGWYSEIGAGLNRILDLFRFDITYRLKEPRRVFLSFGAANLF